MIMPYVDRDPLRNAYRTKTNAALSGVSFDKMRLQQKQNAIDTAIAATGLGLQLGKAVYNVFEAKKMEEAKKIIYEEDRSLRDLVRQGIYDGTIEVETVDGPDGPVSSVKMPENLNVRLEEFNKNLDEKFKGYGKVRSWAKDNARANLDNAQTWAYEMAYKKGMEDRNQMFSENVDQSYKDAVSTRNPELYKAQVNSAYWMSADKKAALITALDAKFHYDSYEQDIYEMVEQGGLTAAIEKANSYEGSDEDKRTLKKKALEKQKEVQAATTQKFLEIYEKEKERGRSPIDIVRALKNEDIPEEYKKEALEEVKKKQTIDATSYGYERYIEVKDDVKALRKEYKDIKDGAGSLEFDGIPITHKAILDLFEKRLAEYDKDDAKGDKSDITADMYAIVQAYNSDREYNGRKLTETDAINYLRTLVEAGGDPAKAYSLENDIITKGKTLYKPILEAFDGAASVVIKKGDYQTTALANELKNSLADLIKDGASYDDVVKRKDVAIGILSGKAADDFLRIVNKGGFIEGEFNTVDKQEYKIMKEIEAGELDDLIRYDRKTRNIIYAGGSKDTFKQLIKIQQSKLLALGYDTMQTFEKQGQEDIGAMPIYTDKKTGLQIKFQTDGKKLIPMGLYKTIGGKTEEWRPLISPEQSSGPKPLKIYVPQRDRR